MIIVLGSLEFLEKKQIMLIITPHPHSSQRWTVSVALVKLHPTATLKNKLRKLKKKTF